MHFTLYSGSFFFSSFYKKFKNNNNNKHLKLSEYVAEKTLFQMIDYV